MNTNRLKIFTKILITVFLFAPQFQSRAEESLSPLTSTLQNDETYSVISVEIPDSISLIKSSYENNVRFDIYDYPYSLTRNMPDWKRLWINTGALFAGGISALGILEALPDDLTNWSTAERRETPLFTRWWNHVKKGAHWDGDSWVFNFILHPYGGAAYFMSARSCGFNFWYSALYSTCISTIFWEYGIEAFNEIPSFQDLIITPVFGSLLGEGFYLLKRYIVDNNYQLFGSKIIGNIVAFLADPVNELIGYFGNSTTHNKKYKLYAPTEDGYLDFPDMTASADQTNATQISLRDAERLAWEDSPYLHKNGYNGKGINSHVGPMAGGGLSFSINVTF